MALPPSANGPRLIVRGPWSPIAGPFTLRLEAGACAVVVGASGSGKRLFPRMIAGLDPVEAVKYQILPMLLLAGGNGISALTIAWLSARRLTGDHGPLRLDQPN